MNSQINQSDSTANKQDKPISQTPDWLRSFKGCQHYTDEEAYEVIDGLKMLSDILLQLSSESQQFLKRKHKSILSKF